MRRMTGTLFKQFRKIVRAHTGHGGEVLEAQLLRQVVTDKVEYTSQPICWQASSAGHGSAATPGAAIKQINSQSIGLRLAGHPPRPRRLLVVWRHSNEH